MTALGLRFFFAIPDIFPSPLTPSSVIASTARFAVHGDLAFNKCEIATGSDKTTLAMTAWVRLLFSYS